MELTGTPLAQSARERFAEAVSAYGPAMFRAARALLDSDADAEDAVGEAVLRAWQAYGGLRRPASLRPWLIKITVNCAYEHRRRCGRVIPVDDLEGVAGAAEDRPCEGLWDAVCALPPEGRAVVTLFYYEDMTVAQIARALNVPAGTVKSRLSRARDRLRALLSEEGEP